MGDQDVKPKRKSLGFAGAAHISKRKMIQEMCLRSLPGCWNKTAGIYAEFVMCNTKVLGGSVGRASARVPDSVYPTRLIHIVFSYSRHEDCRVRHGGEGVHPAQGEMQDGVARLDHPHERRI